MDIDELAAGLLILGYAQNPAIEEQQLRMFARVKYLDICKKYGFDAGLVRDIESAVIAKYRPGTKNGLALFE